MSSHRASDMVSCDPVTTLCRTDYRNPHEARFLGTGWGLRDVRGPYLGPRGGKLAIPMAPLAHGLPLDFRLEQLQVAFECSARMRLADPKLRLDMNGALHQRACVSNDLVVFNLVAPRLSDSGPFLAISVVLEWQGPADHDQQDLVAIDSLSLRFVCAAS